MSRSVVDTDLSEEDRQAMDQMAADVETAIEGYEASLGLSVLGQMLVGSLGEEGGVGDEVFYKRVVAILSLLNLMRDGHADRPYDQVAFAETVSDLSAIATCGSRSLLIPALASVLVSAVANGRRNNKAEEDCVEQIKAALHALEDELKK